MLRDADVLRVPSPARCTPDPCPETGHAVTYKPGLERFRPPWKPRRMKTTQPETCATCKREIPSASVVWIEEERMAATLVHHEACWHARKVGT